MARPRDPAHAVFRRAQALVEAKRYVEAIASVERALAIDPDFTRARCYLV